MCVVINSPSSLSVASILLVTSQREDFKKRVSFQFLPVVLWPPFEEKKGLSQLFLGRYQNCEINTPILNRFKQVFQVG